MAKIPTNISEKVFNISAWRGVNEASEGEASLKAGEASRMRNFRVTSGGALTKRPGSRNVAGLLNAWALRTESEAKRLFSEVGKWEKLLYPRAEVTEMGMPYVAGEPENVGPDGAPGRQGWYLAQDPEVWALDECREVRPQADIPIEGGAGTRGELTLLGTGSVELAPDAEPFCRALRPQLWPGARVENGALSVTGTPVQDKSFPTYDDLGLLPGIKGFLMQNGRLFEHAGTKVIDNSDVMRPWKRYSALHLDDDHFEPQEEESVEYWKKEDLLSEGDYFKTILYNYREYIVFKHFNPRLGVYYEMYTEDVDNRNREGSYTFGWYGYPLTVTESTYEWYFKRVYADTNEVVDKQVRGIWSGYVGQREVICACCGGFLWELRLGGDGVWEKIPAGEMETDRDVHMFGFDEKLYLLNGKSYKVWDGERLEDVEGYRPLVAVSVEPGGGGTLLESVNRLTAGRRCRFSPDGNARIFQLPERDIASVDWVRDLTEPAAAALDGAGVVPAAAPGYTVNLAAGTVNFQTAPAKGINTLEIAWSAKEDYRAEVCAMRYAELYNGAQDTRVFLYGDGSNRAFYSGLDHDGRPRADYFPDLDEVAVGDANTPVTALIRHYNKLMAFKTDSAWSIGYDTITLLDGTVTAGFYVTPVNRSIGNCALGQAQLVQNRPRTLDGRSVIEWRATSSSGGITGDQRNAERVSQRVDASIRSFDLAKARTFYDKINHEYFVIGEEGTAVVQNLDVDAWYVYTGLEATSMIRYRDELYYGTRDGYLRLFSPECCSDNGEAIDAYWESGAMSFSEDFRRKYSAMVWIGIKPEDNGYLEATAQTDRKSDFAVYEVATRDAGAVPEMERIKLKAKKFTYYKLILRNNTADRTATVVSADIRVRGTGLVR